MPLSFFEFLGQLRANPALFGTVMLTLTVLLVNGWTDAPNAIAGAVSTGALPFRTAVLMAAVCNFLGVLCVASVNASVAETVYSIASFGGAGRLLLLHPLGLLGQGAVRFSYVNRRRLWGGPGGAEASEDCKAV